MSYKDFDEEQLTLEELSQVITYHPLMDATSDLQVPTPGTFVWFVVRQHPRLGRVVSIDPTISRPIVVEVFEPQANAVSLPHAKFALTTDLETHEPKVNQITLHQVILRFENLTRQGYLTAADRRKLLKCLES